MSGRSVWGTGLVLLVLLISKGLYAEETVRDSRAYWDPFQLSFYWRDKLRGGGKIFAELEHANAWNNYISANTPYYFVILSNWSSKQGGRSYFSRYFGCSDRKCPPMSLRELLPECFNPGADHCQLYAIGRKVVWGEDQTHTYPRLSIPKGSHTFRQSYGSIHPDPREWFNWRTGRQIELEITWEDLADGLAYDLVFDSPYHGTMSPRDSTVPVCSGEFQLAHSYEQQQKGSWTFKCNAWELTASGKLGYFDSGKRKIERLVLTGKDENGRRVTMLPGS